MTVYDTEPAPEPAPALTGIRQLTKPPPGNPPQGSISRGIVRGIRRAGACVPVSIRIVGHACYHFTTELGNLNQGFVVVICTGDGPSHGWILWGYPHQRYKVSTVCKGQEIWVSERPIATWDPSCFWLYFVTVDNLDNLESKTAQRKKLMIPG